MNEKTLNKRSSRAIWILSGRNVSRFSQNVIPVNLKKAQGNPKRKMALIFRWYLGLATHWGIMGLPERVLDYQIWCGPSMGAFNDWVKGTKLESPANRRVVEIADQLMQGAVYQYRLNQLTFRA